MPEDLDWVWKLDPLVRDAELRARGYEPVGRIDWPEGIDLIDLIRMLDASKRNVEQMKAREEARLAQLKAQMRRYVASSGGRVSVLGEGSVAEDIPTTTQPKKAPRIPSKGDTPTNSREWRRWVRKYKRETARIARRIARMS